MKKNNNDFYNRISKQEPNIPSSFHIRAGQMKSLKDNSTDLFDLIVKTFTFGYMQGRPYICGPKWRDLPACNHVKKC